MKELHILVRGTHGGARSHNPVVRDFDASSQPLWVALTSAVEANRNYPLHSQLNGSCTRTTEGQF
jgi:hypothetical protein